MCVYVCVGVGVCVLDEYVCRDKNRLLLRNRKETSKNATEERTETWVEGHET